MIDEPKLHKLSLSCKEMIYLSSLLDHFTDWMHKDDRPDHGLNRLKWFREEAPPDIKQLISGLAGRMKWRLKCKHNQ